MTTYFRFQPLNTAPPYQFAPTLDGASYQARVTSNLFGQRWYLTLFTIDGTRVFSQGLVGSPAAKNIQAMAWANGVMTVTTPIPHALLIGKPVDLQISGCTPDVVNGLVVRCLPINPNQFTYPLSPDPGPVTAFGQAAYNINLAGAYFTQSLLVFRTGTQNFEVTP